MHVMLTQTLASNRTRFPSMWLPSVPLQVPRCFQLPMAQAPCALGHPPTPASPSRSISSQPEPAWLFPRWRQETGLPEGSAPPAATVHLER